MKSLIRGGVILSLISLFVVFIYAQTQTEYAADLANDSLEQFKTTLSNDNLAVSNLSNTNKTSDPKNKNKTEDKNKGTQDPIVKEKEVRTEAAQDDSKKLVTKTVSSGRVGAVSRGKFIATAYCLRGRTASGAGVRSGIIAADPRVLRLGTRVYLGAGNYTGDYVVADTGGKIKGNRIDIWMSSCAEARRFGRRSVDLSTFN